MDYEILEHTADLKIKVYGTSFTQLLENAGYALSEILLPGGKECDETREIFIDGNSREQILVRFLNELIYTVQAEFIIFRQFDIEEVGKGINAICRGSKLGPSDIPEYDFKGATYHELDITNDNGKYSAQIVIDI